MPDTFTNRLTLTKPNPGSSRDTWGNKLNANADTIDAEVMLRSENLSDVNNVATARTNLGATTVGAGVFTAANAGAARDTLGLGTAAVANTGTGGADVPTITQADGRYTRQSNNLSDLADAGVARGNLGLGSIATRDVTVSTGNPTGGADGDIWLKV